MSGTRSAALAHYAIVADEIYPHVAQHVARCNRCKWRKSASERAEALRLGAAHVEDSGHVVMVEAVDIDWLVPVPALPRYAARRVVGS